MKIKILHILTLGFVFAGFLTKAQSTVNEDKPRSIPFLYASYALHFPQADFAERFGLSSDIGAGIGYKTVSHWIFGLEGNYLFSDKVNDNPLVNLAGSDGNITNRFGQQALIYYRLNGFHAKATLGKVLPVLPNNKNSGIYLRVTGGMLQHKIMISNDGNNVPQILDEYTQGYDRLCNGFSVSEFVGWQHFSKQSFFHFFGGVEFTQAFTENRRVWDFATRQKISGVRKDYLVSLRIGVLILLKSRPASEYYYF